MKTKKVLYCLFALVIVLGLLAIALPAPVQAMDNGITSGDAIVPGAAVTVTPTAYRGRPYLRNVSVVVNKTATFEGSDFPANTRFTILIGPYIDFGTKSVYIGKVNSGKGKFTFTIKLPKVVRKVDLLAIRLDSVAGNYAFAIFHNDTSVGRYFPTPTPNSPTPNKCEIISTSPTVSMKPNDTFNAKWVVKNTGAVEWNENAIDFKYVSGKNMHIGANGYDLSTTVKPGETITLLVHMKAPNGTGTFTTTWALGTKKITVCTLPLTVKVEK